MTASPSATARWVAAAGDLLLGARCHGCGAAWWGVCPECVTELAERRPRWTRPDPCPAGFPPTVTSSPYDPLLRSLINAHKERQALGLTPVLGRRLASCALALLRAEGVVPGAAVSLVPVPSAARAVRERGFDATAALARTAARRLRPWYRVAMVPVLVQAPGVRDQSGLDARARRANLMDAFRLRGRLPDRPVILVDDLVTTGSSLTEATRVLRHAGAYVLGAGTVAATERTAAGRGSPLRGP
ncbi:MAG TPA: phosphoribosyltransferase family protein [Propionibacteriaceae bacterium]|nr:phosphoribosyltransferase family protein [Propionibacteriaceae bacterium]